MTTSHEPSASSGAGDQPGEKVEAQASGAATASNGVTGAQQTPQDAPISAAAQNSTGHMQAPLNRATRPVDNGSNGADGSDDDESAGDLDDLDEEFDDYDEYEESERPAWLSALRSLWPPSGRAIYVAGAVILVIALLLPAALVGFGARGEGPLAVHPTPTITPTATATPPQKVTIQDPLTKRSTRWSEDQDCSMRGDGYHVTDNHICFMAGAPIKDSYITVTALQVAGVEDLSYGVSLRRVAEGYYYSFEIDGSGKWYFYKATDSVLTLLASHADNPSINKGIYHANTLQVRATGQRFEFFVNNVKVGQVNDSSYAEGTVGLGGNDQVEVIYTNFILTQPA